MDIGRQYLSDLFNLHAAHLAKAIASRQSRGIEREASGLAQGALQVRKCYFHRARPTAWAPILAKAKALSGAPERLRPSGSATSLTVWGGKILDYAAGPGLL